MTRWHEAGRGAGFAAAALRHQHPTTTSASTTACARGTAAPPPRRWLALRWVWVVAGGAAAAIALRVPAISADVRGLLTHGLRLPWLGAAAAAETMALAALMAAQRQLLAAAGARLPGRALAAVVVASTGLAGLLACAAMAGTGSWWLLAAAALAACSAAILATGHRAGAAGQWLARHINRSRWQRRLATVLVPLPGGLGGVEGGVLSALALTGTHTAMAVTAIIIYRAAGYWAPGTAGAVAAAALTHRHPAPAGARPLAPLSTQASPPGAAPVTPGRRARPRQASPAAPPAPRIFPPASLAEDDSHASAPR